ncbi:DUF732 domain-containing protein [Mycolicibacterium llatzerense]|uniref:DUF732 domain-containing protein n=1 Tax=Mycolicibacterium llatzerense TaxID=280871 RepID=UPI0031D2D74D
MHSHKEFSRLIAATLGAGALLSVAGGMASAWPIPITPEQQNFINQAHATGFPGDDDAVLTAGLYGCRLLFQGQGTQGAADTLAAQNGADPAQAARLVRIANSILCTSARG